MFKNSFSERKMYISQLLQVKSLHIKRLYELYQLQNRIDRKYKFFISPKENINQFTDYLTKIEKNHDKLYIIKDSNEINIAFIKLLNDIDWAGDKELQIEVTTIFEGENTEFNLFLTEFIKDIKEDKKTVVLITYNDEFNIVANNFYGRVKFNSNKYFLNRENMDTNRYQDWINDGVKTNPDLSIRCYNGVPDEKLEEYCDLFNETMKDMPDNKEEGFVEYVAKPSVLKVNDWTRVIGHYWFAVYNKNEEMIAKTNVSVMNPLSYQFMIGIKREYRGRKIGKWLYGSMYRKIEQMSNFNNIYVDHHPLNCSAIKISLDTGYKFRYNRKKMILFKKQ